jgi:hypothetical protein
MDRGFTTVAIWAGMLLAFLAGRAYQAAVQAYRDWKKTKASVPILRRIFWALLRTAAVFVAIIIAVVIGTGTWVATGPKPHPSISPASPR